MGTAARVDTPLKQQIPLPRVLRGFWLAIALFSAASFAYCAICKFALHLSYPYSWPLFDPVARFTDFTFYSIFFPQFHHLSFFTVKKFAYPAPVALVFEGFFHTPHPLALYLGVSVLASVLAAFLFAKALVKRGIRWTTALAFMATMLLLSYPMAYLIDRGNIEIAVWIFLVLGIWAYAKGRGWSAAACIGIATALKLFPFMLLALFWNKRQYKQLIFGVFVAILTTVVSLAVVGPTFPVAFNGMEGGLHAFGSFYVVQFHPAEIGYVHSLFTWVKLARVHHDLHAYLTVYMAAVAIGGLLIFFLRIRHMPFVNQILALTIAAVLLPPVSADYTLVHLYIPWAVLTLYAVAASRQNLHPPGLTAAFACFAVILTPQSYFVMHGYTGAAYRMAGPVRALVILILFIVVLRYPFADPSTEPPIKAASLEATQPDFSAPRNHAEAAI